MEAAGHGYVHALTRGLDAPSLQTHKHMEPALFGVYAIGEFASDVVI